ncbi:hypothetical protein ABES25_12680 [Bacillus gobiensis]|uniref:phage tail protein n=1 Tax=Bacillus gobiensis TaxID=1441095 RepID=UPI003D19D5A0
MNERLTAFVGARISEFRRRMAQVNQIMRSTPTSMSVEVDADTNPFRRAMRKLEDRIDLFQNRMDRVAKTINTFGTIGSNTFRGIGVSISSAAIPAVASLAGALGALGPMLAVAGGGAVALGAAFGIAGAGAAAFGAIAVTNLQEVFKASEELQKIQDKLSIEKDAKKRAELLKQQAAIMGTLNKNQIKAYQSMQNLKKTWSDIAKQFETPVVDMFTKSVNNLQYVLKTIEPFFQGVVKAAGNLTDSLTKGLRSDEMTAVFETLNETGGKLFEKFGKAFGYFGRGLLNMMAAFAPLSRTTSDGFLEMAKSFDQWANGLWQSERFEKFMKYVQDNGPKLLTIFGNLTQGLVGMFTAFAPLSADMMSGLVDLTARFKEWGQTLSSNQGFQSFIDYVRANGPTVLSTLGELGKLVLNIAIGLAPLGQQVLGIVNSFVSWLNVMMQTHPMIGQILAVMITLGGIFTAMIPNILGLMTLFSGFGKVFGFLGGIFLRNGQEASEFSRFLSGLGAQITRLAPIIADKLIFGFVSLVDTISKRLIPTIIRLGSTMIAQGARMAAGWLIGMGPIGWITLAVAALVALIIWQWDNIKNITIQVWSGISSFFVSLWSGIVSTASSLLSPFIPTVLSIFQTIVDTGKKLFQIFVNTLSKIWSNIKNIAAQVWTIIKNVILGPILLLIDLATGDFRGFASHLMQIWNNIKNAGQSIWNSLRNIVIAIVSGFVKSIQALWNGFLRFTTAIFKSVRSFLSSIWNSIKSTVINLVIGLYKGIREKMNQAKQTIIDIWNRAKSFLTNINLYKIGVNIIQGLINGIGSMAGDVAKKVMDVAGGIKDKIMSALGIHSPSRWMRDMVGKNIGAGMVVGMDKMRSTVAGASNKLAQAAYVEPQRTSFAYDSSINPSVTNGDFNRIRHDFSAEVDKFELPNQEIVVEMDGREVGRGVKKHVSEFQNADEQRRVTFR